MSYKDQLLNKKFHEDNDIINKEIYNKYYENYNLAIRKKHIFNFLLSKRKLQRNLMNNNPYEININSVPSNKEMMKNPITTKRNAKHIKSNILLFIVWFCQMLITLKTPERMLNAPKIIHAANKPRKK